ncbi:MAG TPA: FkbM family methyltransferase [Gemmatimonadales bacterium]|nr:FkbM family methyltransferase [Gemmatimonadales bacterium]
MICAAGCCSSASGASCGSRSDAASQPYLRVENARLLKRNLADNGLSAEVVEAAAGPVDGTGKLARSRSGEPHAYRMSEDEGVPVRVAGVAGILDRLEGERVNVLKVVIEGTEVEVFTGDTGWLGRVDAVVIELRPWLRDPGPVPAAARDAGFEVVPGGRPELCAFVRG